MRKTPDRFLSPHDALLKKAWIWIVSCYAVKIASVLFFASGGTLWLVKVGADTGLTVSLLPTLAQTSSLLLQLAFFLVGAGLLATYPDPFIKRAGGWLIAGSLAVFFLDACLRPLVSMLFSNGPQQSVFFYMGVLFILTAGCYFPSIQAVGLFLKRSGSRLKNLSAHLLGITLLLAALAYLYVQTRILLQLGMLHTPGGAEQVKAMSQADNILFIAIAVFISLCFIGCWYLLLAALSDKDPTDTGSTPASTVWLEKAGFAVVLLLSFLGLLFAYLR